MADVTLWKTRQVQVQKKADLILAAAERDVRSLSDSEKQGTGRVQKEIDSLTARIDGLESDAAILAKVEVWPYLWPPFSAPAQRAQRSR